MTATAVFAATLFLAGALLFGVQPMAGKLLLPLVGGAPATWNACMLFFQAALLAGYVYAWALARRLSPRAQAAVHLGVLAAGALALPIGLPAGALDTLPRDSSPVGWLLAVLAVSVGWPFFALAASAPLFGTWFAGAAGARGAYALYAASNAGSLAGLLAYPVLVEPALDVAAQARLWAAGYGVLVALAAAAAALALRRSGPAGATASGGEAGAGAPDAARRLRWLALAFVPSSLTLGATTYLTTDVAAVPLLWVVPLALYLTSFVLVFAPRPLRPPPAAGRAFSLLVVCLLLGLVTDSVHSVTIAVPLHLAALLLASLVLHGELARDRPAAAHLAEYFLWIAAGGVCGGIWNALIAPAVFTGVTEYPLAMILGCLLVPPAEPRDDGARARRLDLVLPAALGAATALAIAALQWRVPVPGRLATLGTLLPPALIAYSFVRRPVRFALALLGILAATALFTTGHGLVVRTERSFFGVLRVTRDADGRFLQLVHGNTLHGRQALDPAARCEPAVYYHRDGPLGDVFRALPRRPGARVAVVGLGVGTMAAYAAPGEHWTFYEIDPAVARAAESDFRFLADCFAGAGREVRLGDARLEIARAALGAYDLVVLDAFSSDAVPVHLLTREALALDVARLAPGGALVLHLSNTFLDLRPVAAAAARDAGLAAWVRDDDGVVRASGKEASRWVVMTRTAADAGTLPADPRWRPLRAAAGARPWTDSWSNVWGAIDWHAGH